MTFTKLPVGEAKELHGMQRAYVLARYFNVHDSQADTLPAVLTDRAATPTTPGAFDAIMRALGRLNRGKASAEHPA